MRVLAALLALSVSLMACAQDGAGKAAYKEGVNYQVIAQPVRTSDKSKIEVAEVFWYGCGHYFHFEPVVTQWKKKLPADVKFVRSPALWNKNMETHARAFYTAKALGVFDKVHQPFFNALNLEKKKLLSESALTDFFGGFGVEEEKFKQAFNSFGVTSQVKRGGCSCPRLRHYRYT